MLEAPPGAYWKLDLEKTPSAPRATLNNGSNGGVSDEAAAIVNSARA